MENKVLKFITGNKNKVKEMKQHLYPFQIKQVKIELHEKQHLDPREVVNHKLREALKEQKGEIIVEDDSLYMECFDNKLPGPFIRQFNDTIGNKGLLKIVTKMGNNKIQELVIIGYAKGKNIKFFEGIVKGRFVPARGPKGFNFDPIFLPNGSKKTFAQMTVYEKNNFSARGIAATKLKRYLLKQK